MSGSDSEGILCSAGRPAVLLSRLCTDSDKESRRSLAESRHSLSDSDKESRHYSRLSPSGPRRARATARSIRHRGRSVHEGRPSPSRFLSLRPQSESPGRLCTVVPFMDAPARRRQSTDRGTPLEPGQGPIRLPAECRPTSLAWLACVAALDWLIAFHLGCVSCVRR